MVRRLLAVGLVCAVVAGCSAGGHPRTSPRDAEADLTDAPTSETGSEAGPDARPHHDTAEDAADARADDGRDASPTDTAISAFCDLATQSISPSQSVSSVLAGPSRNAITTCAAMTATPGPDAFYALELDAFTILDLRVDATVDTVVAVRAGCDGPAAELACGDRYTRLDDSPTSAAAPASDASAGTGRPSSRLRIGLPAGRYTVVVDAPSPGDGSAVPFTLTATVVAPAAGGTCASAAGIGAATVTHVSLDGGGPPVACGGATAGAVFYAVDVPAGQQVVAMASATAGERAWQPRLSVLDGCDAATCLAEGDVVDGTHQHLVWVNNAGDTRSVILSVSADGPVAGAALDLVVTSTAPSSQCESATPVLDGTTFKNLDLAAVAQGTSCNGAVEPVLYFSATVLPHQQLEVLAPVNIVFGTTKFLTFRNTCGGACSLATGNPAQIANKSDQAETVLVAVTGDPGPFGLQFSLPPAPAGITVTPTSTLVTTESGGQATFDVALLSAPSASVTIPVVSSRADEAAPNPAALVFDSTNWNQPQTVTVTGIDDQVRDGAQRYTIATGPARSADPSYAGLAGDTLPFTNLDDGPGLVLDGADDVVTSEDGESATLTVRLATAPASTVTVPLASDDDAEGAVSPSSLVFTPSNWNVPQTVTVTGVDDTVADGVKAYLIELGPLASADGHYDGLTPEPVVAHNRDDDFTAGTTVVALMATSCQIPAPPPNQPPLAVDAFGELYALVTCDGHLVVLRSADGGTTVSAEAPIPDVPTVVDGVAIAAGRGGAVYVAYGSVEGGLVLARSTDGGATWSHRSLLPNARGTLRIAAARDTVVIAADDRLPDGSYSGTAVLRSEDGGWSFTPPQRLAGQTTALGVRSDGGLSWLIDDKPVLLASTGANGAFEAVGPIGGPSKQCCYVFGSTDVYAIFAGGVNVVTLADPTMVGAFDGPSTGALAATIDTADVVTLFEPDPSSNDVLATRFGADHAPKFSLDVISQMDFVGAAAVSRHATTAVSLYAPGPGNNHVTFALKAWP
jgi:hypothetical protein